MAGFSPNDSLQAYLDGELSPPQRQAVEQALAASPELRATLDQLRRVNDLARASAAPDPPVEHLDRLRATVARASWRWWQWLVPSPGYGFPALAWGTVSTGLLLVVMFPMFAKAREKGRAPAATVDSVAHYSMLPAPELLTEFGYGAEPAAAGARAAAPETTTGPPKRAGEPASSGPAPALDEARGARDGEATDWALSRAPTAGPLQAGEIDDNTLFTKYLTYLSTEAPRHRDGEPWARERYVITVVNGQGVAVPDVTVQVADEQGQTLRMLRTDAGGRALYFAGLNATRTPRLRLSLPAAGGAPHRLVRDPAGGPVTLRYHGPYPAVQPPTLDVAFILDTTGSMGEEIDRLRATIDQVAAAIRDLPQQPRLRLGLVAFRDRDDVYLTKVLPFTGEVAAFRASLAAINADGGGDTPEHVNAALDVAVKQLAWSPAPAVRLAFLIGDAPPHLDYQDAPHYVDSAAAAAARGVKIHTISTSGNDDLGEEVWRQVAVMTGGRFLFITKGGSAGLTPHHVERQDYSVAALPELILKSVARELAALGRRPGEVPEVTVDLPEPEPVVVHPEPVIERPAHRPPRRWRWPLEGPQTWAVLVLIANLAGWYYAFRRSRIPERQWPGQRLG